MTEYIINAIALFITAWLITKIPCCQSNRGSLNIGKLTDGNKTPAVLKVPQYEIDALASCLLPAIAKYYETEEGNRAFEKWMAARSKHEGLKKPKRKTG